MSGFSATEQQLLALFAQGAQFECGNNSFTVRFAGKPTCSFGEPKTDVYAVVFNHATEQDEEIKISYKQSNADFLENKISAERADGIFGSNWSAVIQQATYSIQNDFLSRQLIFPEQYRRTQAGSITLGWKFELVNKPGGELSGVIPLTFEQKIDIYSGINLSPEKRDAWVCGKQIIGSGIANCILATDNLSTLQCAINNLMPIYKFVQQRPEIYFACKALNCRTFHPQRKWDGNRPLAVQVLWSAENGILTPYIKFDSPLMLNGNDAGYTLLNALRQIGVHDVNGLNASNCSCFAR